MASYCELFTGANEQFARKTSHDKTFFPKVFSSHSELQRCSVTKVKGKLKCAD